MKPAHSKLQGCQVMTQRERLLRTLRFQPVDRVPDTACWVWDQTLDRWRQEGLPSDISLDEYFGVDAGGVALVLNNGLLPAFEHIVLEEKGDHLVVQDSDGAVCEMLRPEVGASIPKYLRHALETRGDWERIRDERLNPDSPGRMPENYEEICQQTLDSEYASSTFCGSVYGWLRNWMGLENISIAIMEDPEWVLAMMTHLTDITMRLLEKLGGRCRIDMGGWWEDMCFNKGPLVSPRWFAENMVPQYRRVTEFMKRECGCNFHSVDCDGNIHQLAPLWLEAGINVMMPMEVAAGNDPYQLRRQYGERIRFMGGIDKRALAAGREAIDGEFARLKPLLDQGGYIPDTDHAVPPDVPWENFCYYRERKLEFIGEARESGRRIASAEPPI